MERDFIPSAAEGDSQISRVVDKATGAVAWLYQSKKGQICAVGYTARARKPGIHYIFSSEEKRGNRVAEYFDILRTRKAQQEQRRKEQHQPHNLQLGHVLRTCWGYEQTNVEFFEVTKLVSKTMVELRELSRISKDTAWEQGKSVPKLAAYCGESLRRKVNMAGGSPSVRIDDVRTARLWNGTAASWSAYH